MSNESQSRLSREVERFRRDHPFRMAVRHWSLMQASIFLGVYALGHLAAVLVGLWVIGHGVDVSAHELLPFVLGYNCLFGLLIGNIWVAIFPSLYYFVLEPLTRVIFSGNSGGYAPHILEIAILGTVAVILGMGANFLLHLLWSRRRVARN